MTTRTNKLAVIAFSALFGATLVMVTSCATAPKSRGERTALHEQAQATLTSMTSRDNTLKQVIDRSYGYVVFPSIAKGGVLVGGAYGRGIVYQQGKPIGFAELNQASFGAQLGGKTFSELIVFETQRSFDNLRDGQFSLGADASATLLNQGAAASAQFRDGVAVFVETKGGLMFDVSISGQQINFQPGSVAQR